MALFCDTVDGAAFIATADSRNTSPEVMQAIAFVANSAAEAVAVWEGADHDPLYSDSDFYAIATENGRLNGADLRWSDRTLDAVMAVRRSA